MRPDPPTSSPGLSTLPIDLRQLSWTGPLVRDYCYAFDRLAPYFPGSPTDPTAWQEALDARRAHSRTAIAPILDAQLRARGAPAPALDMADRLARAETVAVVTGQQAGLFGGPLFTLLKALTAIGLARRVEAEHGVQAVPVFWVDAEDHDLDEIRHCAVLDDDLTLRQVTLDLPSGHQPASTVRLTDAIHPLLDELRHTLAPTDFSQQLFEQLAGAYAPGRGLVEAFCRWLDCMLGSHGLVVFDASDVAAKPLVRSVFERELRSPGETSRLATDAGTALAASGYHAQVTPSPDAVALFELDGMRQPIRRGDDAFTVGEGPRASDQLLLQVAQHPDRFSPNVLLRPIVQDSLFPTVAYVPGPNELAYLGQLHGVYRVFGVPMPLMYPRLTATIVDRATVKFLRRYELPFGDLQPQDDAVLNQLLSAQLPETLEAAVEQTETVLADALRQVAAEVLAVDPTLKGVVETTQGRMERDIRTLRGKIIQAAKRRDETLRRQFHRARSQAFPGGAPQERSVGFVYFLNRYGPGLVERLLADLPLELGRHWLLTV